jgi:hypothetical protein
MTTDPGSISIVHVLQSRRAITPPALTLNASSDPLWLALASTASSLPSRAPKSPPPNVRTVRRSPAAGFVTQILAFKIKTAAALSP